MDYTQKLRYHFRPQKGWVNDPNGLIYFDGYYHVFYQHAPDFEQPWKQPMHWGHARTKDFLNWEELPVALYPDQEYDNNGCWSGTATVKDGKLYLIYSSVHTAPGLDQRIQTVSIAWSSDGIHFEKYANNPVIDGFPADGGPNFRDPAICRVGAVYYCVMASGNPESQTARLLLYKSADLLQWDYVGIMKQWPECHYAECPSFMSAGDQYLLTASVRPLDEGRYFTVMYGPFTGEKFSIEHLAEVDKGPDQYAGQAFRDHKGRNLLITWAPGWPYAGYAEQDVGCMSVPRELKLTDGRITAYPVEEVRHLLKDEDPCLTRTENGFVVARTGREPLVYEGPIHDLKILRDGYLAEIFVNGGEEVYTVLL